MYSRIRRLQAAEAGFTLVEQVVSLLIVTVVFTALAYALLSGLAQGSLARQNQQAADLLNQSIENSRALPYDQLAMRPADLNVSDPLNPATCNCYNPTNDSKSGSGVEPLVLDAAGSVYPHVKVVTQNGNRFSLRSYVTSPADSVGGVYKRLTVVATWTSRGEPHTRVNSTLVAPTQRGLPLPDFKFTGSGSALTQCRNPGDTLTYSFTVKNNGARDEWGITATSTSTGAPSWNYYSDVNGNGSFESVSDTALSPAGSGLPGTGVLEPTQSKLFLAVAQVPSAASAAPPYSWVVKFTARSEAQPAYEQELTTTTNIQSAACSGPTPTATPTSSPTSTSSAPPQPSSPCTTFSGLPGASVSGGGTLYQYYFHNVLPNNNNTAAQAVLTSSKSAPTGSTLWNYGTDVASNLAGRQLNAPAGTGPAFEADWRYQMPAQSKVKGTATVTVFAAPVSGSATAAPTFSVTLDRLTSAGAVQGTFGTSTFTQTWGCTGFRAFTVAFTVGGSGVTVDANEQLRVRVKVTNSVPMILAYDTATHQSGMVLPITSGVG